MQLPWGDRARLGRSHPAPSPGGHGARKITTWCVVSATPKGGWRGRQPRHPRREPKNTMRGVPAPPPQRGGGGGPQPRHPRRARSPADEPQRRAVRLACLCSPNQRNKPNGPTGCPLRQPDRPNGVTNCSVPFPLRQRDDIELLRVSAAARVSKRICPTAKGAARQRCPGALDRAERDVGGGPDRIAAPGRTDEVKLETDSRAEICFRNELRRHAQSERHGVALSG